MQSDPHHDETLPRPAEPGQHGSPSDASPESSAPVHDESSGQSAVDPRPPAMPGPPGSQPPPADLRFDPADAAGAPAPPGDQVAQPAPIASTAHVDDASADELRTSGPPSGAAEMDVQAGMPSVPIDPAQTASPPAAWLDQVCPYLLSEDGTWRSTQPDPGHRCMAQDPPGELPPMFQERFCLSDRHVRCEWFKSAQAVAAVGASSGGTRGDAVEPASESVAATVAATSSGGGPPRPTRPILIGAGLIGGFLILVLVAVIFGSGDGGGGTDASPSATQAAGDDATPRPTAAPEVTSAPTATPEPTQPPLPVVLIEYEVQPDERLVRIGDKFGIRRQAIIRANDGMDVEAPNVETGQIILVPVPGQMARDEIRAVPGFVAFVEADGG